ncbi:MAG: MucB/RseB C-terminal domain-containing protein [Proteobacteria bacterium]|nr:MucB/RseB C-terminal domain-containing protein [Pseudomonadota bacterium]
MNRMRAFATGFGGALMACAALSAHAQSTPEALTFLRQIYEATQKLSYSGTFMYHQGTRSETSRITRLAGPDGGRERLELLDGEPREIFRSIEGVRCYLPQTRTLKLDQQGDSRGFPAMVSEGAVQLATHYTIRLGRKTRVAGYECRFILLEPNDALRYGHALCADPATGMLLKSITFNEKREHIETFAFTQLSIGSVTGDAVRPPAPRADWRVEDAKVQPVDLARAGWSVAPDLPGFRKIVEVTRMLRAARPVSQVVFSDGLAAVSIFIESVQTGGEPVQYGMANVGGIHIFRRAVADHLVTVVGEAPAASVRRAAERVLSESCRGAAVKPAWTATKRNQLHAVDENSDLDLCVHIRRRRGRAGTGIAGLYPAG